MFLIDWSTHTRSLRTYKRQQKHHVHRVQIVFELVFYPPLVCNSLFLTPSVAASSLSALYFYTSIVCVHLGTPDLDK